MIKRNRPIIRHCENRRVVSTIVIVKGVNEDTETLPAITRTERTTILGVHPIRIHEPKGQPFSTLSSTTPNSKFNVNTEIPPAKIFAGPHPAGLPAGRGRQAHRILTNHR
jgi:hypothetical protein